MATAANFDVKFTIASDIRIEQPKRAFEPSESHTPFAVQAEQKLNQQRALQRMQQCDRIKSICCIAFTHLAALGIGILGGYFMRGPK